MQMAAPGSDLQTELPVTPAAAPAEDAPLFIFGADHSGNTIVYRMLAYHPDLTWFSQFSLRSGEIPGRSRRPGAHRFDRALRFLPHVWEKGDPWPRRLVVPRPDTDEHIWRSLLEEDAGGAAKRVREQLRRLSAAHGGKRVLAKRPRFHRHLDVLHQAFPAGRFLMVVRDGRPVALSNAEKALRLQHERGGPTDRSQALQAAAAEWVEILQRAERAHDIDLLEVRYEDFCDDVHGTLTAVLDHAGLDPSRFPFERCPPTLQNRNARWMSAAEAEDLRRVTEIESDALVRHGYPL